MSRRLWSAEEVRSLGVATDLVTAGSVLGVGRTLAHDLARRGEFPVPVLRLGSRYVVPTAPLLRLLDCGAGGFQGPAAAANTAVAPSPTEPT